MKQHTYSKAVAEEIINVTEKDDIEHELFKNYLLN